MDASTLTASGASSRSEPRLGSRGSRPRVASSASFRSRAWPCPQDPAHADLAFAPPACWSSSSQPRTFQRPQPRAVGARPRAPPQPWLAHEEPLVGAKTSPWRRPTAPLRSPQAFNEHPPSSPSLWPKFAGDRGQPARHGHCQKLRYIGLPSLQGADPGELPRSDLGHPGALVVPLPCCLVSNASRQEHRPLEGDEQQCPLAVLTVAKVTQRQTAAQQAQRQPRSMGPSRPKPQQSPPPVGPCPMSSESIRSVRIRSTTLVRVLHGFVLLSSEISDKMIISLDTTTIILMLVVSFLSLSRYLPLV